MRPKGRDDGASTVDVLDTITCVAPNEWDALCAHRPFAQHRWLRLAETVLADHQPWYLLVRRRTTIVAAAAGALKHRLRNPTLDSKVGWMLRRSPFLHIAVPLMETDGLFVRDGRHAQTDFDALFQALDAFVHRQRFPFFIIDQLPALHPALTMRHDYQRFAWVPETRLDIAWTSPDEYLAGLPRKKRQEINRMGRRAEREGIVVEPMTPTAEHGPLLDRLVGNVLLRHREIYHFGPDLFVKAATVLGDDMTVLAAYRGDSVVGCVALLRCDDNVIAKWIGRDYERTAGTAFYYALVAACVKHAISMGVSRLYLGASAYETKKQFGVSLEARSRLFATRSRVINWGIGKLNPLFRSIQER